MNIYLQYAIILVVLLIISLVFIKLRQKNFGNEINKLLNEVDIKIINVADNKFICGEDINRLVRFIKLNFNILEEKYSKANDLKTYEKSEINLPKLFKKGLSESEIYPKDELQCEYFTNDPTYLDLSKGQKQFVLEKKIKNFKSCL